MQRYTLTPEYQEHEAMEPDDSGKWVRYEDAEKSLAIKLAGKDAVIAELKKDVAFYKRYQTEKYAKD